MKRPRIAVVGRSGQLAHALRTEAVARQSEVVLGGRPDVDITNPLSIARFLENFRPDLVINASAYTAVDKAESEPESVFRVNAEGVGHLAELCRRMDLPLIHISTDFVFDGAKHTPYVESDPAAPLSVYGASKAAGESALRERHARHVILRTSWVYSAYGANFVKTMLRLGAEREELGVVADQHGAPTHARNLAAALMEIAPRLIEASSGSVWGTYHLTGAYQTTWHGFATEIFRQAALRGAKVPRLKAITTAEYPVLAPRPPYSVLDNTKFIEAFGIALPDWRASLADCLNDLVPLRQKELSA